MVKDTKSIEAYCKLLFALGGFFPCPFSVSARLSAKLETVMQRSFSSVEMRLLRSKSVHLI